ncbi:MAG: VCBS repeat-containing protein [Steroidobacteraceae bacterium]|jgi:hypothetical protein|nr:VCBS repeat-containing protein [Steroidobacteraceae bacterium]
MSPGAPLRVAIALAAALGAACTRAPEEPMADRARFDGEVVATAHDPWGKVLADLNGDGLMDVVVAERGRRRVVVWLAPDWKEETLVDDILTSTGLAAGDVNDDGQVDLVIATPDGVYLAAAPQWSLMRLGEGDMHDVLIADIDGDGRMDVVGRNQTAFSDQPAEIALYLQTSSGWRLHRRPVRPGEGLALGDIDSDGRTDLVVNGAWWRNLGPDEQGVPRFEEHDYAPQWKWPHASIAIGDLDGDGRLDIVLAPAELAGDRYRVSAFIQPRDPRSSWRERVLLESIEAVQHGLQVADFDGDGRSDVLLAQMRQGADPDRVQILLNPSGGASAWPALSLSEQGSHSVQAADIDGDGDVDILGANWSAPDAKVELWRNRGCDAPFAGRVIRRVLGENTRGKNLFVHSGDLNGDGVVDLAAGDRWFENPGRDPSGWLEHEIAPEVGNIVLLHDFDQDGRTDILYTPWRGPGADPSLGVAWNLGDGRFAAARPWPGEAGDFLQGAALIEEDEQAVRVALSWHADAPGVEVIEIPRNREGQASRSWISHTTQQEALSAGDIDGDGDRDLLLGTLWLQNDAGEWRTRVVAETEASPDRNLLLDMNGDGRLDAVVGFEAISTPGEVVWYENPGEVGAAWREHRIAEVIGPMSLAVADADGDGRADVFVGEHNLETPEESRLWLMLDEGAEGWSAHVLHTGDEHHDGLAAVDLDGDGDVDVASIGWSHGRVHLYEALASHCNSRSRNTE